MVNLATMFHDSQMAAVRRLTITLPLGMAVMISACAGSNPDSSKPPRSERNEPTMESRSAAPTIAVAPERSTAPIPIYAAETTYSATSLDHMARITQRPAVIRMKGERRTVTQFADRRPATPADVEEAAREGVTIAVGQQIGWPGIVNTLFDAEIRWMLTGAVEQGELSIPGDVNGFFEIVGEGPVSAPDRSYLIFLVKTGLTNVYSYDPMFFEFDPATGVIGAPSEPLHPLAKEFAGRHVDELVASASQYIWEDHPMPGPATTP